MVTEKKIKVKNKEYWILIHSIRRGSKIIQKKKYIGKILPRKERLEYLKKEFLGLMMPILMKIFLDK